MSVEIHWNTLTTGPDGEQLAEIVRAFIHEKFQQVTLPRFIRSVQVHSFDFGRIAPEIEIKDICDPLPDFYDEQEGSSQESRRDGDEWEVLQGAEGDEDEIAIRVDQYLVVFLKFMASVTPGIEHDFTMGV